MSWAISQLEKALSLICGIPQLQVTRREREKAAEILGMDGHAF